MRGMAMSLVVSLRVPDGHVIAADSLSTGSAALQVAADLSAKCPKCKETIELKQLPLPVIPVPLSSFSYTQKLFPLYRRYGIATFGMNALQGQTVYRHMKQFEADNTVPPSSVQELGAQLQAKFQTLLEQQIKELQKAPDNF